MIRTLVVLAFLLVASLSCSKSDTARTPAREVVLYSSLDEPYLRPILKSFEDSTGLVVRLITDAEATKTAGLAERVEAEKSNPHADVYWGNEPFHTIRLAEAGCFDVYRPAASADVPARWRDSQDRWLGIGLRARMLVVSTRKENEQLVKNVTGVADLGRPELKGRVGICHPGFGTASGHVAALYVTLGREKYLDLLRSWRANDIKLLGGNSVVAEQVASGNLLAGLTDNDDVANAKADNQPVDGVAPDQDAQGTLLMPTTLAVVKNAPHPDNAKRLADFLASPEVEKQLIAGRYLAYSVRAADVKGMNVDYAALARQMPAAVGLALDVLQDRAAVK